MAFNIDKTTNSLSRTEFDRLYAEAFDYISIERQRLGEDSKEIVWQSFERDDAFIHRYWQKYITDVQEAPTDSKSKLQEWTQRYGLPIPTYDLVSQTGPAHAPLFHIRVSVQGHGSEIVEAQSRRKGEHLASKNLLERIMNT